MVTTTAKLRTGSTSGLGTDETEYFRIFMSYHQFTEIAGVLTCGTDVA